MQPTRVGKWEATSSRWTTVGSLNTVSSSCALLPFGRVMCNLRHGMLFGRVTIIYATVCDLPFGFNFTGGYGSNISLSLRRDFGLVNSAEIVKD